MSIVKALVAARAEMTNLVADEQASISGGKGTYKYKYASLLAIVKAVVPALAKAGVLLTQPIGSNDGVVTIQTLLISQEDNTNIKSEVMSIHTTGDPKDMAAKVTTARRIQLLALLALAVEDEAETERPVSVHYAPTTAAFVDDATKLRKAAQRGNTTELIKLSPAMQGLVAQVRNSDKEVDAAPMAKATLSKLCDLVGYEHKEDNLIVLSFLHGRVIHDDTPPMLTVGWLGKELKEGSWGQEVSEAWRLATA